MLRPVRSAGAALVAALTAAFAGAASPPTPPVGDDALPASLPAARACNAFGIELFRAVAGGAAGRNVFISPYSMSQALTMAAEGARRETEAEMAHVLHLSAAADPRADVQAVHAGYRALGAIFTAGAGAADPATRERIETLQSQLDAANKATERLESKQKWNAAQDAGEAAGKIASELNGLLVKVDRYDLRVANALWVERMFDLVPAYVKTIDQFYGSGGVTPLNFREHPEDARRRINDWVEQQTERRIKDLIPPGGVDEATRLVITHAVSFKGQRAVPSRPASTPTEHFTHAAAGTSPARMMHDQWRGSSSYAAFTGAGEFFATPSQVPQDGKNMPATYPDDGGFQLMELPYKGGEMSMVILLPRTPDGLGALEARLSAESLGAWIGRLEKRAVDAAMPRFRIEYEQEMSRTLQELGMRRAFMNPMKPGGAQFPGISSSEDPAQQLFIGAVQHKAWIDVSEKGTEAAAATSVAMAVGAAMQRVVMVPFTPQFHADRPFLFVIRHVKSGAVVFIGRVMNPGA